MQHRLHDRYDMMYALYHRWRTGQSGINYNVNADLNNLWYDGTNQPFVSAPSCHIGHEPQ